MENFNLNLSSKLEFRSEYCWLPMPGRRENFTGLLICIICRNLSNNANGHFTLATLPLNLGRRGFKYPQYLRKKITIILTIIWIQIIFRAKVVYKTNSGNVLVRIPRDEKTKQNWHAAAHSNKLFRTVPRCSKFCQQKCF